MIRAGDQLGPYKIVEQLGQGGMATVYKAYHAKLDRYVAVKIMHASLMEDVTFQARFQREARIIAQLEHPSIVPVYDFEEHEGKPYLVMKYIEGRTLKHVQRVGALPLPKIVDIMEHVASALDYAHSRGILHRDIKPSNIILDENDTPYLTDFGLARIAKAGESTLSQDMLIGTPQYISPEQASGKRELDPRTDVYSLGVVLYEMVVGRVPFNADTPFAIVHDQIYSPLPLPSAINPEIPEPVERVLLKALAKDPDARYANASAMVADFESAIAEAGLDNLDPNRASAASAAVVRQKEQAADPRPVAGIPAPVPNPDSADWLTQADPSDGTAQQFGQAIERGVKGAVDFAGNIAAYVQTKVQEGSRPLTEEERIRKYIAKKHEERMGLIGHLTAYLIVNLVMWGLWATDIFAELANQVGDVDFITFVDFPWPIFITAFWGIGMLAHYFDYRGKYGAGAERREREVQRELARQRVLRESVALEVEQELSVAKAKNDGKAKRGETVLPPPLRLTDDGELTESYVEEVDNFEQQEQRRRRM